MTAPYSVFCISDRSGHTAETLARSVMAQFPDIELADFVIYPFVNRREDAERIAARLQAYQRRSGRRPVVFSTLTDPELERIINDTDACVIDLFGTFLGPIEEALGVDSAHTAGLSRREVDERDYQKRIEAIEFAMKNDDGLVRSDIGRAEVIITGVSRTGKTPTCIYLAMNFGIRACNYPLIQDDLERERLPACLQEHLERLVGFTISPARLWSIRQHRRPNSGYADRKRIEREIRIAEQLLGEAGVPVYDTSDISIEELSARIMRDKRLLPGFS
ncbi:MAG: pyruvate, phosphate dikinase/phosphoenolpyruvate synthase regulator [Acidobacteriota bacterium]|nr:pyruvate, phosphate dikinase/phosphoenolpyruvate synthase regulator [Acidobacteriota bacterium]